MNLRGARVLITGGSLGIGKATARLLVKNGAKVGITGRRGDRLKTAAEDIGAFAIPADVAKPGDVDRTIKEFVARFGGMDCLINNAGTGRFGKLEETSLSDFEDIFRVNVYGAALMASKVVPIFKKQGGGNIINIGSTAGKKGFESGTVYAASKFALRGMTQCWQAELRRHSIRVMLIEPSEVATAFANPQGVEREAPPNKLTSDEIAHVIKSVLEMDDRGMVPEMAVWATNPW